MPLYRSALVSVFVAAFSVLVTVVVWAVTEDRDQGRDGADRGPDHVEVLRDWDQRRAAAWDQGSPRALRGLYVPRSRTGARDVRMLRAYVEQGLAVRGLETQLISVEEVRQGQGLLVLDVVDRVSAAEVVGEGLRRQLPVDQASTRRIELRRVDGSWLVAEVVAAVESAAGEVSAGD